MMKFSRKWKETVTLMLNTMVDISDGFFGVHPHPIGSVCEEEPLPGCQGHLGLSARLTTMKYTRKRKEEVTVKMIIMLNIMIDISDGAFKSPPTPNWFRLLGRAATWMSGLFRSIRAADEDEVF